MTKAEFQAFAVAGAFNRDGWVGVVIRGQDGVWQLWCHAEGFRGEERFCTARGDVKTWVGIDTVYAEVRRMGYSGPISVEG